MLIVLDPLFIKPRPNNVGIREYVRTFRWDKKAGCNHVLVWNKMAEPPHRISQLLPKAGHSAELSSVI
jgi:hypothetical protein